MEKITEMQYELLKREIYDTLMANDDYGIGEMGGCNDAAEFVINEWCKKAKIEKDF